MATKKVYTNPQPGQPLMMTVSSGCKTPKLDVKFCNLIKGFYYPNSPKIPRYSVTCLIDPEKDREFLTGIQAIEKNEEVETIIKNDTQKENNVQVTTGKCLIKFQSKDRIPVYINREGSEPELIELEDELAKGEQVVIIYDILRYTKKNTLKTEHGISFKPSCIHLYPKAG